MTEQQFKELLEAAYKAKVDGDRERVAPLAGQMLSMARNTWEKGEARSLLAWAQAGSSAVTDGTAAPARVTVVNFDIEFGSLVWLMVKTAIASIPAVLILGVLGFLGFMILGALAGAWVS